MATVTVNLGSILGPVTYRASGFVHGLNATLPPASLVTPLSARFWRGADFGQNGYMLDNTYPRVISTGATVELVLSDSVGYPAQNTRAAEAAAGNFTNVDPVITTLVNKYKNKAGGAWTIGHDIWNEPDHTNFWPGTAGSNAATRQTQFNAAWKHIYDLVRSLRPGATIVGPSACCSGGWTGNGGAGDTFIGGFSAWIKAFLAFCNANACLPNRVSWHENGGSNFTAAAHADEIRNWMQTNLGQVLPVEFNEMMAAGNQWRPSEAVTYFAQAEKGMISQSGGKSFFPPEPNGGTLGGLLTSPTTPATRSIWWAYQKYGAMLGNLMTVTTTLQTLDGLASYDGTTVRALIANHTATGGAHTVTMSNIPAALVSGGKVRITTQAIANSEQAAVAALPAATTTDVTVTGNAASVSPTIGAWGAMSVVVVSPGVSSAAFTVSGGGGAYAITGSTATLAKSPGPTLIGFVHIVGAVFFVRATSVALLIGAL